LTGVCWQGNVVNVQIRYGLRLTSGSVGIVPQNKQTASSATLKASRDFQIFAKPVGAICNLDCKYCYYLEKEHLFSKGESLRMADDLLEEYIVQQIAASAQDEISFSWHGGEPTLLGLDYFEKIVTLQHKHRPPDRIISNGIQTNGTLLDEKWCRFLKREKFTVGLSLDGPRNLHDSYRVTKGQEPTHREVMRGYNLLRQYRIPSDLLCVVHAQNVHHPLDVYRFFKQIKAQYIGFLPLVERSTDGVVSERSVSADALGSFLCTIFDEWLQQDIGRVMVQMFEEVARTAMGQEHALCIFRQSCGDVPVIEHNGDFFSCDHFVTEEHRLGNIRQVALLELLESMQQRAFGQAKWDRLPGYCRACEVLDLCHGGCPKDRFLQTEDGEPGLNYLCAGYKQFFKHTQPFSNELAIQSRLQQPQPQEPKVKTKTGRNDPCPCGSGRKYKNCCLGKKRIRL